MPILQAFSQHSITTENTQIHNQCSLLN
jgi:hypothetical protein